MPVQPCRANGKPGYKWGPSGHCYPYTAGDDASRREAKRKAIIQGIAAGEQPTGALIDGQEFSASVAASAQIIEGSELAALQHAWQRAIEKAAARAATQFAVVAAADWQPPVEGAALTVAQISALAAALNKELVPIWQRVVLGTVNPTLARIELSWDVKHPLPRGLLDKAAKRTGARLGEAVQPILRDTVQQSYLNGLSSRETSSAIQKAITEAAPWQADMLARTDLNSLSNGASKGAAAEVGMGFKTWLATLDDKTRIEHAEADGQTIPINDTFTVGGEEADYPGDPALSDAMSANCRCTLVYGSTLDEARSLTADAEVIMMSGMATKEQRRRKYARRAAHAKGEALVAGAQGGNFPLGARDETWNSNAAEGSYTLPADANHYMWRDPSKPADQRNAYKLPFVSGDHAVWGAITAIAQRLGATQIPDADKAGVRRKVAGYYAKARAKYNDDSIQVPWASTASGEFVTAPMIDYEKLAPDEVKTLTKLLRDASPDDSLAPKLPQGMDATPTGVGYCTLGGKAGYSGGGLCYTHDGSEAGMRAAMRRAQADARKRNANALVAAPRSIPFDGTAAIEGKLADDNSLAPRVLLPDSLSWPEMPVSFMAQTVTAEAHDGAEVAGRVDEFARKRGKGKMRDINFSGELTTPFGINEIAPMIEDKTLRYVSADLGSSEWSIVDRNTLAAVDQSELDINALQEGAYALGLTSGKIKAVTLVPTQAIEGAMVALTASADEQGIGILKTGEDEFRIVVPLDALSLNGEALVAAASDWAPPREWFDMPELPGKMPLTVTREGRVYGHLATWDSCHVSFLPSCLPPPKSASNYAYFHVAELDTAEGDIITVGKLMFSPTDGGHADRGLSAAKASQYYDRTGMVAAFGRVSDGTHGIWFAGAVNPSLTPDQRQDMRRELRLNPPSGDWRPINGQYELICGLAVAVPGYPTPRATITVTASAEGVELDEAIIASSGAFAPDPQALMVAESLGIADEDALAERQMRVLAARAEGMDALAALVEN